MQPTSPKSQSCMFLPVTFPKDFHYVLCRKLLREKKKPKQKIHKILAALLKAAILATTIVTNATSRCIFKLLKKILGITSLTAALNVSSSKLSEILGLLFVLIWCTAWESSVIQIMCSWIRVSKYPFWKATSISPAHLRIKQGLCFYPSFYLPSTIKHSISNCLSCTLHLPSKPPQELRAWCLTTPLQRNWAVLETLL